MRSICIVGFAPQTRDLANAEPPEVEIWGMNSGHTFLKRWDRWFQVHPQINQNASRKGANYGRDAEHVLFLKTCAVPLYMNEPMPDMPTARLYPYEEVIRNLGRDYITSSTAHALGLAILEGPDEIKVYGVNVATDIEYIDQRPCIEWMLGIAQGRGIKVTLPGYATLLKGRRYPLGNKQEVDFIAEHLKQSRADFNKSYASVYQLIGAYKALSMAGQSTFSAKMQFVSALMRLQKDRGKVEADKFTLRRLGGTDTGMADMPEIEVPPELMEVEGIMDTAPNIVEMPMAAGVRVR